MPAAPSRPEYGPGDRVRHTKYGEGTVKAVEPGPRDYKVIKGYLHLNGKKCVQIPSEANVDMQRKTSAIDPKNSCLIVIGGDGSVLRAAHQVLGTGIPILGINLGTLGYLAEIERSNWREMMQLFLDGAYEIETRMMLEGRIIERGGKTDVNKQKKNK